MIFNNKTMLVTGEAGFFTKKFILFFLKKFKPKYIILNSLDTINIK